MQPDASNWRCKITEQLNYERGVSEMKNFPIIFGVHNHQPIGNFDHVIKKLTEISYRPFLKAMLNAEWFKFHFHSSGILLDWWLRHSPDIIEYLKELVSRGQVELIAGGYYEPILAALLPSHRREQISLHLGKIEGLFGVRPLGLWLTERVWASEIVEDIVSCGIEYLFVDDRHFLVSGFDKDDLYGYYITESSGVPLRLFPIDENLRYHIPFSAPEKIKRYLTDISQRGRVAIYFDDGEKFGAWPGTDAWVYERGWLNAFLDAARDWLNDGLFTAHARDIVQSVKANGLSYLPNASYEEMEEWSLPASKALLLKGLTGGETLTQKENISIYRPFIRGGHWKGFFIKYSESNWLHKRNLFTSINAMNASSSKVKQLIFSSQCNDAYWHGVFGGLYLPHLRCALWDNLLSAELMLKRDAQKIRQNIKPVSLDVKDIDFDGIDEVIISGKTFFAAIHLRGGQLREYSNLLLPNNYLNVLTRRFESYHEDLKRVISEGKDNSDADAPHYNDGCKGHNDNNNDNANEDDGISSIHALKKDVSPELLDALIYDWYERHSLIDHFFDPSATPYDFKRCDFREWGDFVDQPFDIVDYFITEDTANILLKREGGIYEPFMEKKPLGLEKSLTFFADGGLQAKYYIKNLSSHTIRCNFGVEWNLYPQFLKTGDGGVFIEDKPVNHNELWDALNAASLSIDEGNGNKLIISFDNPMIIWGFPVETVSQSEEGYEKTLQGISFMAFRWIELLPKGGISLCLRLKPSNPAP